MIRTFLRGSLLFAALCSAQLVAADNTAPVVTNVVAEQLPGTGMVRVTYDVADAENDSIYATVTFFVIPIFTGSVLLPPTHVTGDVNRTLAPGMGKQILWDALLDYPGRAFASVIAKVSARDGAIVSGEMVYIPAGPFIRGSDSHGLEEKPQREITLDAFYIDKYEVTVAEYRQFVQAGGYDNAAYWSPAGWAWRLAEVVQQPALWSPEHPAGDENDFYGAFHHVSAQYPGFPMHGLSWYEAEAYARFVGKRLPTEAEWEKAARSTDGREYPWGSGIDPSRGNYSGGSPFWDNNTKPVGYYDGRTYSSGDVTTDSPGPYGTYDQVGNVAEWCADLWDPAYYASAPASNPPGPVAGELRVQRGGAFGYGAPAVRCASRSAAQPTRRDPGMGVRLARSAP